MRKSLLLAATMRTSVLDRGAAADGGVFALLQHAQQPVCASIGMSPIRRGQRGRLPPARNRPEARVLAPVNGRAMANNSIQ